jgi:uncharacterized membrane protein YraQ (UPF0718 family)
MDNILKIPGFILESFIHIWPYLLITIPLSVVIKLSGASKYITSVFSGNPLVCVFLATVVGAFSPFCSCGVIPVIASLLIGGVPLAPVMSFWIASPSMDPEIFFLSRSVLGWDLAVWRLVATFIISLGSGVITHILVTSGILDNNALKIRTVLQKTSSNEVLTGSVVAGSSACTCESSSYEANNNLNFKSIAKEVANATLMVVKFMGIAFLLSAIIKFYIPSNSLEGLVTKDPSLQVLFAVLSGIPLYTTNITALPLAAGLIDLGLNKGAALAFLIAGATTTLPAMAAVYGLTKPRVFILYLAFATVGSLITGMLYNILN